MDADVEDVVAVGVDGSEMLPLRPGPRAASADGLRNVHAAVL